MKETANLTQFKHPFDLNSDIDAAFEHLGEENVDTFSN